MLLCIDSVIGAGKTSLAKRLAKAFGTKAFLEPVKNNPVLPRFYKGNQLVADGKWDTNPYGFLLQIYFLNMRFRMIKEAQRQDNNILDRSIYGDKVFMSLNYQLGNTTKEEWELYKSLLHNMLEELPYSAHKKSPDLMIYLKISLKNQLKHIKMRGRSYEQLEKNPSLLNYYKNLQKKYDQWYKDYDKSPKMVIDVNKYDFVHNQDDLNEIITRIDNKLVEINKK